MWIPQVGNRVRYSVHWLQEAAIQAHQREVMKARRGNITAINGRKVEVQWDDGVNEAINEVALSLLIQKGWGWRGRIK